MVVAAALSYLLAMMSLRAVLVLFLVSALSLTGQTMAAAKGANDPAGRLIICQGMAVTLIYVDAEGQPTEAPHFCPECLAAWLTAIEHDETPTWINLRAPALRVTAQSVSKPELQPARAYAPRAPPLRP